VVLGEQFPSVSLPTIKDPSRKTIYEAMVLISENKKSFCGGMHLKC